MFAQLLAMLQLADRDCLKTMGGYVVLAAVLCLCQINVHQADAFNFANSYGSGMVLQREPMQAAIWGTADAEAYLGVNVTVVIDTGVNTTVKGSAYGTVGSGADDIIGVWKVLLPAMPAGGPYRVTASLEAVGAEPITMSDIIFGDIWICSGQSNMNMELYKTFNGTEEMEMAENYPNIRIFSVGNTQSLTPINDLVNIKQEWTRPSAVSVAYFSSLCWTFGRTLHERTGVPIGLLQSSWGGTSLEAWSSPEALAECYGEDVDSYGPMEPTVLWNGMIHPLLNMTITGTIWYQGEANARRIPITAGYECTFPAMIRDWRRKFLASTEQTDPQFPFGFVQLAGQKRSYELVDGFPHLRWKQTANKGRVPNEQLPNTFMAVAHDLPDFDSPYGPNHPRDKPTVAARLMLGARAIHLKEKGVEHGGPLPIAYRLNPTSYTLELQYEKSKQIEVRSAEGFEVCCSDSVNSPCDPMDYRWTSMPMLKSDRVGVTLSTRLCESEHLMGHRYAWRTNPCPYKECAVYALGSDLPAPVYVSNGRLKDDSVWHNIEF